MIIEALQIPLAAGLLNFAADIVQCRVPNAPRIHVRPDALPIQYNHRNTEAELTARGSDTISPYPRHTHTVTGGTAESYIKISTETKFEGQNYSQLGLACLYYDKITVNIELDATIYIAKEHRKGSCKYREILAHEKKHIRVDKEIVNKYAERIGAALKRSINHSLSRGPYPLEKVPEIQQDMLDYVVSVVKTEQSLMDEERFRRQQAVDTLEEYERIRTACD